MDLTNQIEKLTNYKQRKINLESRIKKLEKSGIIQNYVALVSKEKVERSFVAFCHIKLIQHTQDNVKKFETHDVGTIFTEAGSGATQAAIKVNTTLDTYGSVTVRNKSDVEVNTSAFQVENASNGANETNLLLRSVNLGSTAYSHGLYAAKSHRFAVSNNTTPMVQVD